VSAVSRATLDVIVGHPYLVAATAKTPEDVRTTPVDVLVSEEAAAAMARLSAWVDEALHVVDRRTGIVYVVIAGDEGFLAARADSGITLFGDDRGVVAL
jgi:hypothetical protein